MERVVEAARGAGFRRQDIAACAALALGVLACPGGWAQEAGRPAETIVAQAGPEQQPQVRVQVQASTLPRLDTQEASFLAPRVDMTLYPAHSHGLGAVVGMSSFAPRPEAGLQPYGLQPNRPGVDLGLRWSPRLQNQQIDITAWRRMSIDDAYSLVQQQQPVYGARVEMNLASSKSSFGFVRGILGLQLESGARISVKRKYGGPMIYYRTTF